MVEEGIKRKLAAILSADVEGYSLLMDDDAGFAMTVVAMLEEACEIY
jgi:hypothetical protein